MKRMTAGLLALSFVLAACGGADDDDDGAASAPAPASTTTTAAAEEVSVAGLEAAVLAFRDGDACGGAATALPDGIAPFEPLATFGDSKIVLVTCEVFAYQATYDVVRWDGDVVHPLRVEQWIDGEVSDGTSVILGGPVFADDQLVNLEKGRGAGDCGQLQVWDYTGDLVLREVRVQDCAVGEPDVERWEVVHEAPPSRSKMSGRAG